MRPEKRSGACVNFLLIVRKHEAGTSNTKTRYEPKLLASTHAQELGLNEGGGQVSISGSILELSKQASPSGRAAPPLSPC